MKNKDTEKLKAIAGRLRARYAKEIYETRDWSYFLKYYTINFYAPEGSGWFSARAYPVSKDDIQITNYDWKTSVDLGSFRLNREEV